MANGDQISLFDMFADYGFEEPKEEVKEEVTVEEKMLDEDFDDAATEETPAEPKKAEPKKATAKSSKTLSGPVKVVGTGWTFEYGEPGVKYDPKDVVKAAFNEGFKEVALANINVAKNSSVIYIDAVSKGASNDDVAVGGEVTVIIARKAAVYKAEDFPGLDVDEISVADVLSKFVESHPEFKGCGLKYESGIATPVFEEKIDLKKDSFDTLKVWGENGIYEVSASEAALLFEDAKLYKSESDIIFPVYSAGKGATSVYMLAKDFGLNSGTIKTVEEKYVLPFTLYLETFGQRKELTSADFNGKTKVTKQEVIDFLKPQYRAFQSKSRKFDIIYEKAQNIVSVALISGEKGAAAIAAFPLFRVSAPRFTGGAKIIAAAFPSTVTSRVEETDIGTFSGTDDGDTVKLLSFQMKLPRIPINLLNVAVQSFKASGELEDMVQIYYDSKGKYYYLSRPEQEVSKVHVSYKMQHSKDILVLTLHSHNTMAPEWSMTDNEDEVYTGLFGVVGYLDREPEIRLRAGMEGSFLTLGLGDIFG